MIKNPDLLPLFEELRKILTPYEEYFSPRHNEPGYYDLWVEKDITIEGRKHKGVFFAGLIIQKSYVGFYYMPVYLDTEIKKMFGPELLKTLKGKSCFYIKNNDPILITQVIKALEMGLKIYKKRGWI